MPNHDAPATDVVPMVVVPVELLHNCRGAALEARDWAEERRNREQMRHWQKLVDDLQDALAAQ